MVLKGTKKSLRTGNTLRNFDGHARKRTGGGAIIVRQAKNLSRRQYSDEADDSFLTADAVGFSLNKKGRWSLPTIIENNLRTREPYQEDEINVAMLTRHAVNRQNDTIDVTVLANETPRVEFESRFLRFLTSDRKKARRRTYCNGLNVLHSGRGKSTKETRKKRVVSTKKDLADLHNNGRATEQPQQGPASGRNASPLPSSASGKQTHTPATETPKPTPEIRYDVIYPLPPTSSLSFQPKFVLKGLGYHEDNGLERRLVSTAGLKPSSKGSKQRHKTVDYNEYAYDDDDYYDDYYDDEDCDDDFDDDDWGWGGLSFADDGFSCLHQLSAPPTSRLLVEDVTEEAIDDKENLPDLDPCIHPEDVQDLADDSSDSPPHELLLSDALEHAFDIALIKQAESKAHFPATKKIHKKSQGRSKGGRYFYQPESYGDVDSCLEDARSEGSYDSNSSLSASSSSPAFFSPFPVSASEAEASSASPSTIPTSVQVKPFPVTLPRDAMHPDHLRREFGAEYTEALCKPRKVVLDVTDRVQDAVKRCEAVSDLHLPSFDLSTLIVLTCVCPAPSQDLASKHGNDNNVGDDSNNSHPLVDSAAPAANSSRVMDVYNLRINSNCFYGTSYHGSFSKRKHNYIVSWIEKAMKEMLQSTFPSVQELADHTATFVVERIGEKKDLSWLLTGTLKPSQALASTLEKQRKPDFSTVSQANGWTTTCVSILDEWRTRHSLLPPLPPTADAATNQLDEGTRQEDAASQSAARLFEVDTLNVSQDLHGEEEKEEEPTLACNQLKDDALAKRNAAEESSNSTAATSQEEAETLHDNKGNIEEEDSKSTEATSQDEEEALHVNKGNIEKEDRKSTAATSQEEEAFCGICYEELTVRPTNPNLPSLVEATALKQCGHWFCDSCWRTHLHLTLREGTGGKGFLCPEYRCHTEVDAATLLTLLNVRDVTVTQRRGVEREVMMSGRRSRWCPSPTCGRVLQILPASDIGNKTEPTSVTCACGKQFCFSCHGDPHWPLPCALLPRYHALLVRHALSMTTEPVIVGEFRTYPEVQYKTVMVRGKHCPKCSNFIEKNGGCPFMHCVCGHDFWWCCKKPTTYPHQCIVSDDHKTTKRFIKHIKKVDKPDPDVAKMEWLRLAVHHRAMQHPRVLRAVAHRTHQLRVSLLQLCSKGVLRVGASDSDPKTPVLKSRQSQNVQTGEATRRTSSLMTAGETQERRHVRQVTSSMAKLKLELHHVIENAAAFIHFLQTDKDDASRSGSQAEGQGRVSAATLTKVKDVLDRLLFLMGTLELLFGARECHEMRHVVQGFSVLQGEVKVTLSTLASLLAPLTSFQ